MSIVANIYLKRGHVQPIWAGHPWVYAQAIDRIEKIGVQSKAQTDLQPGDEVQVFDPQGNKIGRGFWSARRAIPVRIMAHDEVTSFDDPDWLIARIKAAIARRTRLSLPDFRHNQTTNAYRLLHAEGDQVPGLVVDVFGVDAQAQRGVVVVQIGTAGLYQRSQQIIHALEETLQPKAILDRTTSSIASAEGFSSEHVLNRGESAQVLRFEERGLRFEIPAEMTQKTGFYFDQRPLRERVEALAHGRRVLDAYCYIGPIAMSAARGKASSVLAIDNSVHALEIGSSCARLNELSSIEFVRGDVMREFPKLAESNQQFDIVILDPPKLAPTRSDRSAASSYQTKLVALAAPLVAPGGLLILSSCSAALASQDLARCLAMGAKRANRTAILLERLNQGPDHPVPAAFHEGFYLSTLIAELN